ncbi:XRE family transcriptional regulator [Clostridium sp. D33t1_170424_F3]|uniref:XRE family transcriptional regulator n=1 Tax=Clostridium sp. D33t1_170424_F3 TaxID=2787099 RepID=UPI0018A9DA49|nr:XRE family transcriptional regulator [Clostridium sp. D33t1_170424_F3]
MKHNRSRFKAFLSLMLSLSLLLPAATGPLAISRIELDKCTVTDYELMCFCKILNVDENWLYGTFYKEL